MSFGEFLAGFDYSMFDTPLWVVTEPCPYDLGQFNAELARIAGYEQTLLDFDGQALPRLRAVWGGTELTFFCGEDVPKYVHRAFHNPMVGWIVYDAQREKWWGPLPLDKDKWESALTRKHGPKEAARLARYLKAQPIISPQECFTVVARCRVYVEQYVHPDVAREGWEQARWFRELAPGSIDQRTVDEYNDYRLFAKRIAAESKGWPRSDRKRRTGRLVEDFRKIARKKNEPYAETPHDLPFELRCNLTYRSRDILGKLPERGIYEQLFVLQEEDGTPQEPGEQALDVARSYWKRTLDDALVHGVHPGHKTPADQMAARVENLYKALADAERQRKERRAEEEREEGVDSGQVRFHKQPTIYMPGMPGF